jgi:hypothetical protein
MAQINMVSKFLYQQGGLIVLVLSLEYEEKTFEIMWEMSAPGSDSEECFLRLPHTEYFYDERPSPEPLEKMPNVSASTHCFIQDS